MRAEIGRGPVYNSKWPKDSMVAELDFASENTAYNFPLHLKQADYYFQFDWAARQGSPLATSQILVSWNGKSIIRLHPFEEKQIYRSSIVVRVTKNTDVVTLAGAGLSDGLGATFTNIKVYKIHNSNKDHVTGAFVEKSFAHIMTQSAENLLQNGDFESLDERGMLEHWRYKQNGGYGKVGQYSSSWNQPDSYVIDLGSSRTDKTEFETQFQASQEFYYINFDFAPAENSYPQDCEFSVLLNGQVVFNNIPRTELVQRYFLKVHAKIGANSLTFRGQATPKEVGTIINNVENHQMI